MSDVFYHMIFLPMRIFNRNINLILCDLSHPNTVTIITKLKINIFIASRLDVIARIPDQFITIKISARELVARAGVGTRHPRLPW